MNKGHIIVNATALNSGGALTILEQFLEEIPDYKFEYLVFVNSAINPVFSQENIRIISKSLTSLKSRFFWDTFGVKKWLKDNRIKPIATISLQNTNFRTYLSIPNFIYFHNSIPFSKAKWNPFKNDERELWFYKHIYPFFVRIFINKKTEVFVQSNSIKESFAEYFDFQEDKIHVIVPKMQIQSSVSNISNDIVLNRSQLNLFYPATPYLHKNHATILKALKMLDIPVQEKITLYLTCEKAELGSKTSESEIHYKINFMGKIDFKKVLQMYLAADALLFPSFIETIGLPLIEAASTGMRILVSDLPYSREILENYSGATFVEYNNAKLWSESIRKLFPITKQRYLPLEPGEKKSWKELFSILENRIQAQR